MLICFGIAYGHGCTVTLPVAYSNANYMITTSAISQGWALTAHEYNVLSRTSGSFVMRMLENNKTSGSMNAMWISIGY